MNIAGALIFSLVAVVASRAEDFAPTSISGLVLTFAGDRPGTYSQRPDGTYIGYGADGLPLYHFPAGYRYSYEKQGENRARFASYLRPLAVTWELSFTSRTGGTYTAKSVLMLDETSSGSGTFTLVRLSTLPMTNSSTRVRVDGAGSAILGLVVLERGIERLTFRAAGPALAKFGVSGTMPNPKIAVYRDGILLAENDDWERSFDPSELGSGPIGAFPFESGSRDAVVPVGALPGNYTAVVSSADGVGGEVLLEAYASR